MQARSCVAALPPQDLDAPVPAAWAARDALCASPDSRRPSPYISTCLWFDREITRERFWSKVWSPQTLSYDFYDLSNIRPGWEARPSLVARNLIYSARVGAMSDDKAVAAAVREIGHFTAAVHRARVLHADVRRIPMAIPAPHPGSERLRPGPCTPVPGLWIAGDWLDTQLPASMESATQRADCRGATAGHGRATRGDRAGTTRHGGTGGIAGAPQAALSTCLPGRNTIERSAAETPSRTHVDTRGRPRAYQAAGAAGTACHRCRPTAPAASTGMHRRSLSSSIRPAGSYR